MKYRIQKQDRYGLWTWMNHCAWSSPGFDAGPYPDRAMEFASKSAAQSYIRRNQLVGATVCEHEHFQHLDTGPGTVCSRCGADA